LNSNKLKAIYENTKRINNGELTIDREEERFYQNDFSGDSNLIQLANKSFYDIKSIFEIIINIIPCYYSGLFSFKFFSGIKENLINHLLNEYVREGIYDILFTFSRILTSLDEEKLYQCIQRSNTGRNSDVRGDIDIVDYLYRQICPEFRVVQIERDGNSMVTSLCYRPNSNWAAKSSSKNLSSNLSQLINIRLNYENASEKLIGLDYWQSPLEKIFMIKLVSESIKQDCQISREGQTKTLNICSETLVDIFAYIVILWRNHLLPAHLMFSQQLISDEKRDICEEGLYMNIFASSLIKLFNYNEKTQDILISVSQWDDSFMCSKSKFKEEDDSASFLNPTPRTKACIDEFREVFYDPDESIRQIDFYISKDFFDV
jgi:hypothetical protein